MRITSDLNIRGMQPLLSPQQMTAELPLSEAAAETVDVARDAVKAILAGRDDRLLVVLGPCSIHDPEAAMDYARRLAELHAEVGDRLLLLMRVYFEKPRTTIGWRGLINDPHCDGSCDIEAGLRLARQLLLQITELGLGTATEFLEPIVPQYLADLVSWAAIGARTTESQTHRDMAGGLSMPVGFKNSTEGNLQIAVDAMVSCAAPKHFLGIDGQGRTAIVHTAGNRWSHLVLRGGRGGPNYAESNVAEARDALAKAGLPPQLMIDCSHANSGKKCANQAKVLREALRQRREGNANIIGLMVESNLVAGSQSMRADRAQLVYGQSITDECIGWDETTDLLREAHAALAPALV